MREIKFITLHCTATQQTASVEGILNYWKNTLGWQSPGYHHLIKPDGTVVDLHPIEKPSNGVAGHNSYSIHISYIGGIDSKGKALDNRTDKQKQSMYELVKKYKEMFPTAKVQGHRDFLKKGTAKWKDCPSFEVSDWLSCVGL